MEHFAFPGNKEFAADYKAHSCIIHEGLLCLFIVCETMFTIDKSRTISNANDTQAQPEWLQILAEGHFPPKSFHCPLERERRLEIQREQRRSVPD